MNAAEISTAIATAYADYRSTNFDNMHPRMIADMIRNGIGKAMRAINALEAETLAMNPRGGRFCEAQLRNVDILRQRAEAVYQHLDREIERNARRAA